jgi:Uma2 family endonuclease
MSETRLLSRVEVAERMTSSEFLRYAPEDQKAELIDGVMIVHSPPLDIHERLQVFLLTLLRMYIEAANLGEVRGSRTPVELEEDQTPEPDILFVAREREEIIQREGVFGPPDLVIEILSASTATYDRGAKFRAYERAGVRELWLTDPYGPAGSEFYQLEGGRFRPVMPDPDGLLRSVAVSGFAIQVEWLWPAGRFIPVMTALKEMATPSK